MLTHLNDRGEASMVDVSGKNITERVAKAEGFISMNREAYEAIKSANLKKGDALSTARIAGIMGAKQTSTLIPLCHQIPLEKVAVDFEFDDKKCTIRAEAATKTTSKTGVEMEAITAVLIALDTLYDMAKALDRAMVISNVRLLFKDGGKTGRFEA